MSESKLVRELMVQASKLGARLFRNQVGSYKLADGRYISSGLCVGSSDLVGWTPVKITPAMVGETIAVFTAVEAKTKTGRLSAAQINFIRAVGLSGGLGIVARSIDDLNEGIKWRG